MSQGLQAFRRRVGKDEPDDPAHSGLLMPAERVALEMLEGRRPSQAVNGLGTPGPRPSGALLEATSAPDHRAGAQEAS